MGKKWRRSKGGHELIKMNKHKGIVMLRYQKKGLKIALHVKESKDGK